MVVDSEPIQQPDLSQSPQPPLKRSRSPNYGTAFACDDDRGEKRIKIEPATDGDLDEIARMVQAVQDSVMKEFLTVSDPNIDHKHGLGTELGSHMSQPDEVFETTEHEQVNIESVLEAALDQQRSPARDEEPRPDTLWNNPRDYTRRKHIIPALGALVSARSPKVT